MTEGTEINISVKASEGTIDRIMGLLTGTKNTFQGTTSPPIENATHHGMRHEDGEVFNIFPSTPGENSDSGELTYKTSEERIVHTFVVPPNTTIQLNPGDITQEVLFQPYDTDGNFMEGLILVYVETGLGGIRERVYAASAEFHNPKTAKDVGHRRKWQVGYELKSGDKLITTFTPMSKGMLDTKKSVLSYRVFSVPKKNV